MHWTIVHSCGMSSTRHSRRVAAQGAARADAARSAEAEIASLATSLQEITGRIGRISSTLREAGDEELAVDLLAVQKSLEAAVRRLERRTRR